MTPAQQDLDRVRHELGPQYDWYTTCVSHSQMAISFETAAWVGLLAQQAKSAVDFGSGFTSYVLRKYCDTVWSVDDNEEWLTKTRQFCEQQKVSTDRIVLMDEYRPGQHDLVVYDYAGGDTRNRYYDFAFAQVAPGGVIVCDDMQFGPHAEHARAAAMRHEMTLVDESRGWTLDQFARWASYAVR